MSTFSFTNIAGEKATCSCTQYDECNMECSLYRKITGKQTNYDLLVSKTPEELAEWLDNNDSNFPISDGGAHWLSWLKSPADKEEQK